MGSLIQFTLLLPDIIKGLTRRAEPDYFYYYIIIYTYYLYPLEGNLMPEIMRVCPKCGKTKSINQYTYYKGHGGDNYRSCHACEKKLWAPVQWNSDPRQVLWLRSKENAHTQGIAHTITPDEIPLPNTCRYFGWELDYRDTASKRRRWSHQTASIDRIDSSKGYIPGNIQVISLLANRMKQDATIEEMLKFAIGVLKTHG